MAQKKGKRPYIYASYIFCLDMYGLKRKSKIKKKYLENSYRDNFFFLPYWRYPFFVILHIAEIIYICKGEGSAFKKYKGPV
jgi:hypothetical protein